MSEKQFAGHVTGRGHGPGGRLVPMAGDVVETRATVHSDWHPSLFVRFSCDVGGPFMVMTDPEPAQNLLLDRGYEHTASYMPMWWRWPHKTGIEGCDCGACRPQPDALAVALTHDEVAAMKSILCFITLGGQASPAAKTAWEKLGLLKDDGIGIAREGMRNYLPSLGRPQDRALLPLTAGQRSEMERLLEPSSQCLCYDLPLRNDEDHSNPDCPWYESGAY